MIRVFDYVYYRTCKFYQKFNESAPWVFGVGALIISQYSILIIIDRVNFLLNKEELYMKGRYGDVLLVVIIIFDIVRYLAWRPYEKLELYWKDENRQAEIVRGVMVLLYLFGSLIGMLYLSGFFNKST